MAHALAVRAALASADYAAFFRLYASAPALGRALMDIYVPKLRFDALTVAVKAFKPTVPLPFLAALLGFVAPPPRRAAVAATSGGGSGEAPAGGASEAAGTEGAGKSVQVSREGEAGESGSASPLDASQAAAGAAGAGASLATPAPAPAAAVDAGEPPPGCKETYLEGEFAAKVRLLWSSASFLCNSCVMLLVCLLHLLLICARLRWFCCVAAPSDALSRSHPPTASDERGRGLPRVPGVAG